MLSGIGPKDARIVIVGEAPGEEEEKSGIPFTGSSGKLLTNILEKIGIDRSKCYITNTVKVRPPDNNLARLPELGLTVEGFYPILYAELSELKPNLIITVGNVPFHALTGLNSVVKWRGSVLFASKLTRPAKLIPIIHPAACLREWKYTYFLNFDLARAKAEAEFPEIRRKKRDLIINPTFDEVMSELSRIEKERTFLSIDLETYMRSGLIKCVGVGNREDRAMCIPIIKSMKPYWQRVEEVEIWKFLAKLLTDKEIKKIAQNAQFELTQLSKYTNGKMTVWMDTLRAHALVHPEFPHSLAFLTSIYTDMPYYKDEGKISGEKQDYDMLQTYNCKDVVATFEIAMKLEEALKKRDMHKFYHFFDNPLAHALWKMQTFGVKIDLEKLKSFKVKVEESIKLLEKEFLDLVGFEVNPKSPAQMKKFLYEYLKLPKKLNRKTKKETTNEDALLSLYAKSQLKEIKILLDIRQLRTLKGTFLEMSISEDGRIRTSYGVTETGRLSSSKDLFGIGANLQNIPSKKGSWVREIFIPDEKKVLMKADLSQADARVVAWLAGDAGMKKVFNSGRSIHKFVGSLMFGLSEDKITKDMKEYALAKTGGHATNYDEGAVTFSIQAGITLNEAKVVQSKYLRSFPNIVGVFHSNIQKELSNGRVITTPLGRKRFFTQRWGDSLFREAYAYIPQSTTADVIDLSLLYLDQALPIGANLLIQVHDEIVLQCFPEQVKEVSEMVKRFCEIPVVVKGEVMIIPV